jgi:hypothetical protein
MEGSQPCAPKSKNLPGQQPISKATFGAHPRSRQRINKQENAAQYRTSDNLKERQTQLIPLEANQNRGQCRDHGDPEQGHGHRSPPLAKRYSFVGKILTGGRAQYRLRIIAGNSTGFAQNSPIKIGSPLRGTVYRLEPDFSIDFKAFHSLSQVTRACEQIEPRPH